MKDWSVEARAGLALSAESCVKDQSVEVSAESCVKDQNVEVSAESCVKDRSVVVSAESCVKTGAWRPELAWLYLLKAV